MREQKLLLGYKFYTKFHENAHVKPIKPPYIESKPSSVQELAALLARLKAGSHKALIFTQMTKMLDVLEAFLNIHGHTYLYASLCNCPCVGTC